MSQHQQTFFLGRQPILNTRQEIVGFELLFRSSEKNFSDYIDQNQACMSLMFSSMSGFGFNEVLGGKIGFINITEEVLLSDLVEVLSHEKFALELLETVNLTEDTRQRCQHLQSRGYLIALDDHVFRSEHIELYRFVDIVKIDILETSSKLLPLVVNSFKEFPIKLLAEKVETTEQFDNCLALGFALFQGYFFAHPVVMKQKILEPSKVAMLRLLSKLQTETEFHEIEESFRSSPELSLNLVKLVNSVGIGLREKIKSLRHAITLLGVDNLRRWVQLALYACTDSRGVNSPLLELAAVRGRFMECIVMDRYALTQGNEMVEAAFLTGILSLADILLEASIDTIINELDLSDEISAALIHHDGELGAMLSLAESIERADFDKVQSIVSSSNISISLLLKAQLEAYNWRAIMKS